MAEAEIDRLSIEISADSGSASANLEKLAASLRSLEGGVGASAAKLRSVSAALKELKGASAGIDASALASLQRLSTLRVSVTLGKNISSLANALSSFPQGGAERIRELSNALAPLSGVKITAASLKGLTQLPEVLRSWSALDTDKFARQIAAINAQLPKLAANMRRVSEAYRELPVSMRGAARAARSVTQSNQQLATSANAAANAEQRKLGLFNKGAGILSRFNIGMAAVSGATYALKRAFEATVGQVNTYIENMNLFNVSMGRYADSATEFGEKVQSLLGIDFADWARNQGVFMTLATGMGETAERASVMSQQLTQLGYDISSFYNIDVNDAMLKLQSGLSGELEPLRRLGWDLSQARMQIEATNLGIEKNVSEMTQAEKVALRYRLIMRQVTQTHGDMARTISSPANQLRVLQAQLAMTARAIGQLFIPALNKILPVVIAVVKAIRMLAQELANFLGIDLNFDVDYSNVDLSGMSTGAEDTAEAIDDVGSNAEDAKKKVEKLKNTVMAFDELNKLNDVDDSADDDTGGVDDALDDLSGLLDDLPLDTYDFLDGLNDTIGKMTDELAKRLADAFKKLLPIIAGIGAAIAAWKLAPKLYKALEALKALFTGQKLGEAVKVAQAVDKALDASKISKAASAIKELATVGKAGAGAKVAGLLGAGSKAAAGGKVAGLLGGAVDVSKASKAVSTIDGLKDALSRASKAAKTVKEMVGGVLDGIKNILPKTGPLAKVFSGAGGFAKLLASNTFLAVTRVVELALESESFRKGLSTLVDWVGKAFGAVAWVFDTIEGAVKDLTSNMDFVSGAIGSAINGPIAGLFSVFDRIPGFGDTLRNAFGSLGPVFDDVAKFVEDLDLDFTDLLFTVGGFALLGTPMAPLGLFLLALEGITIAVRALGAITEDCVTKMDPLEGVSEEVRAALGTAMDSAYDFENALAEIDYSCAMPTDEQKQRIANDTADMANTVLNNLDSRRNQELANIDMLAGASSLTEDTLALMRDHINEKYDQIAIDTETARARINEIVATAQDEGRALQQGEVDEIQALYQQMYDNLLVTSGAGEADLALIDNNIKNNRERAALEAAETVIQKAQETRDETVRAAEQQYLDIVAAADELRAAGKINDEEYQNIIDAAGEAKAKTVQAAEDQYSQIRQKTEEGLGDIAYKFDFETGKIKSNWDIFCGDVSRAFLDTFGDGGTVDNALKDLGRGISDWWNANIQPTLNDIQSGFEDFSGKVEGFVNDPIGTIKSAWEGIGGWFQSNVIDPITNAFSWMKIEIPAPKLPHISWDWSEIDGPFGRFSIPTNFRVEWYAKGGFPDEGQLFLAREAGPELVGTMGNRNAVANNMQIIQGIEAGVTSAMLQVLPAFTYQQQQGGDVELVLRIDSEDIARATERGQAARVRRGEARASLEFA